MEVRLQVRCKRACAQSANNGKQEVYIGVRTAYTATDTIDNNFQKRHDYKSKDTFTMKNVFLLKKYKVKNDKKRKSSETCADGAN